MKLWVKILVVVSLIGLGLGIYSIVKDMVSLSLLK